MKTELTREQAECEKLKAENAELLRQNTAYASGDVWRENAHLKAKSSMMKAQRDTANAAELHSCRKLALSEAGFASACANLAATAREDVKLKEEVAGKQCILEQWKGHYHAERLAMVAENAKFRAAMPNPEVMREYADWLMSRGEHGIASVIRFWADAIEKALSEHNRVCWNQKLHEGKP